MMPTVATKKLAATRAEIADAIRKRAEIESAPLSRADVRGRLMQRVASLRERALRPFAHRVAVLGSPGEPDPFVLGADRGAVDVGPLLALLLGPDRVAELLQPVLDTLPAGMSAEARRNALAELDATITRLGHAEEDIVESLEAQGVAVTRRSDADPAVVFRLPEASES